MKCSGSDDSVVVRSGRTIRRDACIQQAVDDWLDERTELELRELAEQYATTDNAFLIDVERIYLASIAELRRQLDAHDACVPPVAGLPSREWGVYVLVDRAGDPLYVGMTGVPKKRIARHRREFGEHIDRVDWRPTDDRRSALDLETELIAELQPRMNVAKVQG